MIMITLYCVLYEAFIDANLLFSWVGLTARSMTINIVTDCMTVYTYYRWQRNASLQCNAQKLF